MYNVKISNHAIKQLDKIEYKIADKILESIVHLKQNPRPVGSIKLKGENSYRIRKGNYRILFDIDDKRKEVLIYYVGHRKDTYRNF